MVRAKTVDKKVKAAKRVMKKELHKVKRQAKKQQKELKNQVVSAKLVVKKEKAKNVRQDVEISKLREEMDKLKKKKKFNTSHVSEYNIFIRKQIKAGLTFLQAVKQWNKYKALEARDKRRPSAYNQFIGSQMRLGKTWSQAIALWKLAKAGKLGKKGSTKTITKTVVRTRTIKAKPKVIVRKVKSKPQIKYRTRTVTSKPKIRYRTRTITKIKRIGSKPVKKIVVRKASGPKLNIASLSEMLASSMASTSITKKDVIEAVSADDEEIAFKIVQTYFKEIARFGFKRQLTLDEIINAYLYALARVKRNEKVEASLIAEAVKNSGIRK